MKENKFLNVLLVSFNALKIAATKDCVTILPNHDDRLNCLLCSWKLWVNTQILQHVLTF